MDHVSITESPRAEWAAQPQISGALVLSVTMLGVAGANYVLNLVLARSLSAAEFGDANLAVNLVLIAAAAAATFQLLSARSGPTDERAGFDSRRRLMRSAWIIGGGVGAGMGLCSRALADALNTSTPWVFVVIGVGLPVYLAQAVARGALQGDLRLARLALSYAAEAAVRVGIAVVMLALGYGVVGAAIAISLSFVASALVARHRVAAAGTGLAGSGSRADTESRVTAALSVAATVLLTAQVVIANGDVLLAKVLMVPEAAGDYAAAAVIGRGLYFLSWAVVHSTFPVVARARSREQRRRAVHRALLMVGAIGVAGVAAMVGAGHRLAPVLLGDGYHDAAAVLVPYAIATALFAAANLLASVDLAVGRWHGAAALMTGAVVQTLLLVACGITPMSMAVAQVFAMSFAALLVGAAHLWDNRTELRSFELASVTDELGEH
jgi:O-antigen/teichoic acid export membrane protein